MSYVEQARSHARSVRQRLRYPPNAVEDYGINLHRVKVQIVDLQPLVESVPIAPVEPRAVYLVRRMEELRQEMAVLFAEKEEADRHHAFMNRITVETIQKLVCEYFQSSIMDMKSSRRDVQTVRPRMVAMYLARKHTSQSMPQIGNRFGGRDHTTVLHATRKMADLILSDGALASAITEIEARLLR